MGGRSKAVRDTQLISDDLGFELPVERLSGAGWYNPIDGLGHGPGSFDKASRRGRPGNTVEIGADFADEARKTIERSVPLEERKEHRYRHRGGIYPCGAARALFVLPFVRCRIASVEEPRIPIFFSSFPTKKPGKSFSTMKAEIP